MKIKYIVLSWRNFMDELPQVCCRQLQDAAMVYGIKCGWDMAEVTEPVKGKGTICLSPTPWQTTRPGPAAK